MLCLELYVIERSNINYDHMKKVLKSEHKKQESLKCK